MLLSENKLFFFIYKFCCFYTVRTDVLRENKKFLQKCNLGVFGGENSISFFSSWTFDMDSFWWIKPTVGFYRTGLFMPTLHKSIRKKILSL